MINCWKNVTKFVTKLLSYLKGIGSEPVYNDKL